MASVPRFLSALAVAACCPSLAVANGYQDCGPGTCTTGGLRGSQTTKAGMSKSECEATCTADEGCYGYAHTFGEDCILYMQGPLSGGGTQKDGSHCIIKTSLQQQAQAQQLQQQAEQEADEYATSDDWDDDDDDIWESKAATQTAAPAPAPAESKAATQTEAPAQTPAPAQTMELLAAAAVTQYADKGPGVCTTDNHSPQANFYSSLGASGCAEQCTASATCYGYSATTSGDCKLFTQGPLSGGGELWDGASCFVKTPEPARQMPGVYQDAGPGKCAWQQPVDNCKTATMPGTPASGCASACTEDETCAGYSSQDDLCVLFKHCPLSGGGRPWGAAHCHIKTGQAPTILP